MAAADPFVGRTVELGLLEGELGRVRAGTPRVVLIEGPPGIGKSALVRRFLHRSEKLSVLGADGDEAERLLPYGILNQLLDGPAGWSEFVDRPMGDPLGVGAQLLQALGRPGLLVIVVDDAQWADPLSLRALTFALRRLHVEEVLAVFIAVDGSPGVPADLRRLAAGDRGLHMRLGGLSAEELVELAAALGVSHLSRRAGERIWEHLGGNPFHARSLFEELDRETLEWTEGPLPAPRSFASEVLTRLAACSPAGERLVLAAAVLGRRCPLHLAARLSEQGDPAGPVEEAVAARLLDLIDAPTGRILAFPHPLVRAAVYHGMGPARRTALHATAASFFEGPLSLDHRVAATLGEDAALAAEVEGHAREEAARGALGAAGHLVTAARLTPDVTTRGRLLLDALELLLGSGDVSEATLIANGVAEVAEPSRRDYLLGYFALMQGRQQRGRRPLDGRLGGALSRRGRQPGRAHLRTARLPVQHPTPRGREHQVGRPIGCRSWRRGILPRLHRPRNGHRPRRACGGGARAGAVPA